ncbi:HAMP domain-containing sensor histidine kinase [Clostridium pascui]|uniref:HAMP domain-containing sensor histidine kinase n=1 Tax=Clostridium pascui TaxID=46609 RepID=UPI00195A44A6|nr:ATP-binding protein [Clostridium pascui]
MKNKGIYLQLIKQIIRCISIVPFLLLKKIISLAKKFKNRFIEKLRFSLTFKITIVYMFIISLILMLLSGAIIGGFAIYAGWNAEDNLQKDFQLISDYLKENTEIPVEKLNRISRLDNISISIFDENKNLLYTTENGEDSIIFRDESKQNQSIVINENYIIIKNRDKVYVDWDYLNHNDNNFGYAMMLSNRVNWKSRDIYIQVKDRLINEIFSVIVLTSTLLFMDIVVTIIVLLAGTRASRKTLKPIEIMTNTVKNITIKALDTRLNIRGSQDELKDLARTFNTMLDRIQESYEQQNQFVSDASHELRTPISVIQGYVNMLDRWGKDDKSVLEESISAIKTESESMKLLIEKLLFLARGDKNTQKVEKVEFYLNELIDEIVKETKLIDNTHEIKSEKNDLAKINADYKMIKEALRVFIDNSIKYTPEGGLIKVNCILQDNEVLISVEDTGLGISKEDLPHIFDRFYRADKSRTKRTGGTGLGLSIAKWIIFNHNGRITVESRINVGTKISITLPIIYK